MRSKEVSALVVVSAVSVTRPELKEVTTNLELAVETSASPSKRVNVIVDHHADFHTNPRVEEEVVSAVEASTIIDLATTATTITLLAANASLSKEESVTEAAHADLVMAVMTTKVEVEASPTTAQVLAPRLVCASLSKEASAIVEIHADSITRLVHPSLVPLSQDQRVLALRFKEESVSVATHADLVTRLLPKVLVTSLLLVTKCLCQQSKFIVFIGWMVE